MTNEQAIAALVAHGIKPSAQRVVIAQCVLGRGEHLAADEVFALTRGQLPTLARATVYNTLNLFVDRGLLRAFILREGCVVFDPNTAPHHHFVDDEGAISDIPWAALEVRGVERLGRDVRSYHVIVQGARSRRG